MAGNTEQIQFGLEVAADCPVDSRFQFATLNDRNNIPLGVAYAGLVTYVTGTNELYVLVNASNPSDNASWRTIDVGTATAFIIGQHSVTELNDVSSAGSGAIITATERTKLSGVAPNAEVNVQSDWNESDTTDDAYIQNKPIIPSVDKATIDAAIGAGASGNPATFYNEQGNFVSPTTQATFDPTIADRRVIGDLIINETFSFRPQSGFTVTLNTPTVSGSGLTAAISGTNIVVSSAGIINNTSVDVTITGSYLPVGGATSINFSETFTVVVYAPVYVSLVDTNPSQGVVNSVGTKVLSEVVNGTAITSGFYEYGQMGYNQPT